MRGIQYSPPSDDFTRPHQFLRNTGSSAFADDGNCVNRQKPGRKQERRMDKPSNRVIVIGAGPVGLCLSLSLAQQGIPVCLIEALGDHNFLEQVPRAGTNHPATLELFERIGLYDKLEPRGIIAPLFHYWDRHESKLVAEFDHAHLKDDTRFPYVLQCESIKIVEEALKLVKAHPGIELRLSTEFMAFSQTADGVTVKVTNPTGESEAIAGSYLVSAQGSRYRVRGLHLPRSYLEHRGGLRFQTARLYRAQLHLGPRRVVESVSLEGAARPLAGSFPDRARRGRDRADAA